jgi:hypothetical protein
MHKEVGVREETESEGGKIVTRGKRQKRRELQTRRRKKKRKDGRRQKRDPTIQTCLPYLT